MRKNSASTVNKLTAEELEYRLMSAVRKEAFKREARRQGTMMMWSNSECKLREHTSANEFRRVWLSYAHSMN